MKNFLVLLLVSILFINCDPPEPLPPAPTEMGCSFDLSVVSCVTGLCNEFNPVVGVPVQFFTSEIDALEGVNRLLIRETNNEGEVDLVNFMCGITWVKIVSEDNGTYIGPFNLSSAASQNFEQIRFIDGVIYNNGSEGFLTQGHISFTNPVLSQQSTYRRFEIDNSVSFDIEEYTDILLRVRLVDQVDEQTFVVEETIDEISGVLTWPFYPPTESLRNVWIFHGDSITVRPRADEYFSSYIWNLSEYFESAEGEGYTFNLLRPTDPIVDMTSMNAVAEAPGFGAAAVEDYNLFDNLFSDLILDVRGYTGLDGPLKMQIYNREDGVVRSVDFFAGMSQITHGFDLVIE